jgi:hypothetical protein
VPSVGNDVFEIITLPRQEKRSLQISLTVLLETTVEKRFGSPEEYGSQQLDLLPLWFQNSRPHEEDGIQQQQ